MPSVRSQHVGLPSITQLPIINSKGLDSNRFRISTSLSLIISPFGVGAEDLSEYGLTGQARTPHRLTLESIGFGQWNSFDTVEADGQ